MKDTQTEIKQNIRGANSDKEGNQDSKQWFGTEGRNNIQPEQNEETRIQKSEERLRNLQNNFKRSNIRIRRVPSEEEEEEQEIENLLEQIMKENFPKLAVEIDF